LLHARDVAKAFGGAADFVMLGGMFAGHDESGGERIERDGKSYQRFYGMSSKAAMQRYSGGVAGYRAAEGKEVLVPYRGPVPKPPRRSSAACARPAPMSARAVSRNCQSARRSYG